MPIPTATPAGARAPFRSLRIAVALLAVLQLAAPLAALAADEAPATSHVDHVGAPDDGCHTFHDEHFCQSCRVLTTAPADARPIPTLWPELVHPAAGLPDADTGHPACDPTSPRLARAPPRT